MQVMLPPHPPCKIWEKSDVMEEELREQGETLLAKGGRERTQGS